MKRLFNLITNHQQKIFYLFLFLLLTVDALLPALAGNTGDPYRALVGEAIAALEKADARAAYQALARKIARKNDDKENQEDFRQCLDKIPFYEIYFSLVSQAELKLQEEDLKNAQLGFMAAPEQLDLSLEIVIELPDIVQYEAGKRELLEARIQEIEACRIALIERAVAAGEDKLLEDRPGEALEDLYYARNLSLDQSDENRRYRIGEHIQKTELHYDAYS